GILNGFPYVITANHCGGLTRAWYQGGSNIGVWVQFNPKGTRRADAGLVSEQQASWATGRMYGENPITTVQPKGQNVVGELVCMSGASSGFTCGEIIDTSYNYKIEDGWYYDQLRATYSRARGDSGAPVYLRVSSTTTVLKGIHSGHSSGNAVFSHIGWVISDHGLSGIVTECMLVSEPWSIGPRKSPLTALCCAGVNDSLLTGLGVALLISRRACIALRSQQVVDRGVPTLTNRAWIYPVVLILCLAAVVPLSRQPDYRIIAFRLDVERVEVEVSDADPP